MGLRNGLVRLFLVCLVPLLLLFSFATYLDIRDACEFPKIMRLNHLLHERVDSDPAQRAIWDREIGPRPVPQTILEQERQIVSANILPGQVQQIFRQVHLEAENGDLCRGLGVEKGLENFWSLLGIIAGLAAAIVLLFIIIKSFTWVKEGFK